MCFLEAKMTVFEPGGGSNGVYVQTTIFWVLLGVRRSEKDREYLQSVFYSNLKKFYIFC